MARVYHGQYTQKGAGYGLQTGRGIGNFLGDMYRRAVPHMKTIGKKVVNSPVAQDVFKTAKKAAVEAGLQLAADTLRGRSAKNTLSEKVGKAKRDIASTIENSLSPEDRSSTPQRGRKRKSGGVTVISKKRRRRVRDIFD